MQPEGCLARFLFPPIDCFRIFVKYELHIQWKLFKTKTLKTNYCLMKTNFQILLGLLWQCAYNICKHNIHMRDIGCHFFVISLHIECYYTLWYLRVHISIRIYLLYVRTYVCLQEYIHSHAYVLAYINTLTHICVHVLSPLWIFVAPIASARATSSQRGWKEGPANDKEDYCSVVRTKINQHSIVMAGEVDCCEHVSHPVQCTILGSHFSTLNTLIVFWHAKPM